MIPDIAKTTDIVAVQRNTTISEPVDTVRMVMQATPPCTEHNGWCNLLIDDVNGLFNEHQLRYLAENLPETLLTSYDQKLDGYFKNGGVYDYEKHFLGIDFMLNVPRELSLAVRQIS